MTHIRWFTVVVNCIYRYSFLMYGLTIFGLVAQPWFFRSANLNFGLSLNINLNLNLALILKFAIRIIGLVKFKTFISFIVTRCILSVVII